MNSYCLKILCAFCALLVPLAFAQPTFTDATGTEITVTDTSNLITLGGDLTEIVYALGQENKLVAVDTSSIYPAEATALPKVGYVRNLSAEGVLSLGPSFILASQDAGPPEVVAQLRQAGVPLFIVPGEDSVEGAKTKIETIGAVLGAETQATRLVNEIELDVAEAELYVDAARRSEPSVMFVYARGAGTLSVSGTNTAAHAMIELAGAQNAVTGYEGYKPLTAEAAVTAAPDVLLFLDRGLESVGGYAGLADLPGLALTPAYENERVVALDDLYLLGFGPRVGAALKDLTLALYPEVAQRVAETVNR